MAKVKKKGGRSINVDFTGVEAGGTMRLLPEETFIFEIKEITEEEGESSGQPYLKFTLRVAEGEYSTTPAWDNFSLQPQALWKLRGLLENALQLEVPDGLMDIDLDDLIGMVVKGEVIHEIYEGKPKHRINAYLSMDAESVQETKADTAAKTGGVKKKAVAADKSETEHEPESTGWQKNDKVTFKDGKKTIVGKVISVDDKGVVTVRAGSDEYEIDGADLEAA